MINEEGGIDPEQFRMEAMFDRMDAIGKSVLGLTIQCAQCHDHKFDPISQEEYFQPVRLPQQRQRSYAHRLQRRDQMRVANLTREIRDLEEGLRHRTPDWEERLAKLGRIGQNKPTQWIVIRPVVEDITTGGQKYLPQPDGSFLAQGYAVGKSGPHFWLTNDLQGVTAFRFEQLTDPNLPCNGPGRSLKGMCALPNSPWTCPRWIPPTKRVLKFTNVTADFSMPETPAHAGAFRQVGKKSRRRAGDLRQRQRRNHRVGH
jgi:hypothetical protein